MRLLLALLFSGNLYLSGYVPETGFTIQNNTITATGGFSLLVNGVATKSAKLDKNSTIIIKAP